MKFKFLIMIVFLSILISCGNTTTNDNTLVPDNSNQYPDEQTETCSILLPDGFKVIPGDSVNEITFFSASCPPPYGETFARAAIVEIYYNTTGNVSENDAKLATLPADNNISYLHSGLDNRKKYYYKLKVTGVSGKSKSNFIVNIPNTMSNEISAIPNNGKLTIYDNTGEIKDILSVNTENYFLRHSSFDTTQNGLTFSNKAVAGGDSVAYGSGIFVIVKNFGTVYYSDDGVVFEKKEIEFNGLSASSNLAFDKIVFGNGKFFVLAHDIFGNSDGNGGFIYNQFFIVSSDGENWSLLYSETTENNTFKSVVFDGSNFVIVGNVTNNDSSNSLITYVTDGVNQPTGSASALHLNESVSDVDYDNTAYVVTTLMNSYSTGDPAGYIYLTYDPAVSGNWQEVTSSTQPINKIVHANSKFFTLGNRRTMNISDNGQIWNEINISIDDIWDNNPLANIFYDGSEYFLYAVSNTGTVVFSSFDTTTWQYETIFQQGKDLLYSDGLFISSSHKMSQNLANWQPFNTPCMICDRIKFLNNKYFIYDNTDVIYYSSAITSSNWTKLIVNFDEPSETLFDILYNGTEYVVITRIKNTTNPIKIYYSTDLVTWDTIGTYSDGIDSVKKLIKTNNKFFVLTDSLYYGVSEDGKTWSRKHADFPIDDIKYYSNTYIVISENYIKKSTDLISWQDLSISANNGGTYNSFAVMNSDDKGGLLLSTSDGLLFLYTKDLISWDVYGSSMLKGNIYDLINYFSDLRGIYYLNGKYIMDYSKYLYYFEL